MKHLAIAAIFGMTLFLGATTAAKACGTSAGPVWHNQDGSTTQCFHNSCTGTTTCVTCCIHVIQL